MQQWGNPLRQHSILPGASLNWRTQISGGSKVVGRIEGFYEADRHLVHLPITTIVGAARCVQLGTGTSNTRRES